MARLPVAPKILFLTGAGASVPLGLSDTKQFMDEFFQIEAPQLRASNPELATYLEDVRTLAALGNWDVEQLLDVLQGDRDAVNRLEGEKLFLRRASAGYVPAFGSFVSDTDKILHALHNKVVEHYSEVDPERAAALYRPILQQFPDWFADVPELGHTIAVFTLNYDMAVEAAARVLESPDEQYPGPSVRFVDGLQAAARNIGRRWTNTAFSEYLEDANRANVILVKLHGSVLWGHRPSTPEVIVEQAPEVGRNPGPYETVILYPTEERKEIHREPFRTGYGLLADCLRRAQFLVVIGTSLRDAEVCETIRGAMEDNTLLRIVVMGPHVNHEQVAALLEVDPEKVAGAKARFDFPTIAPNDNPDAPNYSSQMGLFSDLARVAYGAPHLGGVNFGATFALSDDGLWREVRPDQ
jgi:SIR2-like domain